MNTSPWKTRVKRCWFVIAFLFTQQLFAQPNLTSFSPASGPIGSTISITGTNFDPVATNNIVFFGAVKATVLAGSASTLSVMVPAGATYKPISVTSNGLTGYSRESFITTYDGANSIHLFADPVNFTTDQHPNDVAVADFDGDGKPDFATPNNYNPNSSPASISILRNTSSGNTITFAEKIDKSTGGLTYSIAAGDLDGDGKPDIVTSSIFDQTISIFKNISTPGTIAFSTKMNLATGGSPFAIAIADFNNDGRPDVVVVNSYDNTISIFKNTSSGGTLAFQPKIDFATSLSPNSIAVGDFDNDGKTDIAVANELSNTVSVLRNRSNLSTISFFPKSDFATGMRPVGVTAGDLNRDGLMDLVVANNYEVSFSVLKNVSGPGSVIFEERVNYSCGEYPTSISIGDLNGDGRLDVIIPASFNYIYQNNSTGTDITLVNAGLKYMGGSANVIAIADFDGDGKPDLAGSMFTSNRVAIARNQNNEPVITSFSPALAGSGQTVTISGYNLQSATSVKFGNVEAASFTNGDPNTIDAVVATGSDGSITVSNKYGSHSLPGFTFTAPPAISSFSPNVGAAGSIITIRGKFFRWATGVAFGGISASSFSILNDSTLTAVVDTGATGNIIVSSTYGSDTTSGFTFIPPPTITSFTPKTGGTGTEVTITGTNFSTANKVEIGGVAVSAFTIVSPTSIQATLADGGSGSVTVTTFGGKASAASFIFPRPFISSFSPSSANAGALVTITGSNFRSGTVNNIVFFGAVPAKVISASSLSITVEVPPGATYDRISVITNNNIAYTDKPFNLTFGPYKGINSNSFAWETTFSSLENPSGVILADVDLDGKPDMIVANAYLGTIGILKNTSTNDFISFATAVKVAGPYAMNMDIEISMAVGDINSDGKLDIVFATTGRDVSILENTSSTTSISFSPPVHFELPYSNSRGVAIDDFNGDGKADIAVGSGDFEDHSAISIFANTTTDGEISFAAKIDFTYQSSRPFQLSTSDVDFDGKADIVANAYGLSIFRNTSTNGNLSFAAAFDFPMPGMSTFKLSIADLNGDGREDMVTSNYYTPNSFSIFSNTSSPGSISFAARADSDLGSTGAVTIGNLDGDERPDIAIVSAGKVSLLSNISSNGKIILAPKVSFDSHNYGMADLFVGDVDGDGKQDLAIPNGGDNKVTIVRNQIGGLVKTILCPGGNTTLTSNITATTYQWQVDFGNGYQDIHDNGVYTGTGTSNLTLQNIPSSFYNFKFRCLASSGKSEEFVLKFENRSLSTQYSAVSWEEPESWSCRKIPDENTDVIIDSGEVYLNSNATVRSLRLNSGAQLHVAPGYKLTVLN